MLDMDRKFNLVKESLPSNIRSSGTLKAILVKVQHGVGVYLMFNRVQWNVSRKLNAESMHLITLLVYT